MHFTQAIFGEIRELVVCKGLISEHAGTSNYKAPVLRMGRNEVTLALQKYEANWRVSFEVAGENQFGYSEFLCLVRRSA